MKRLALAFSLILLALSVATPASALTLPYDGSWWTVDNGGAYSAGTGDTAGQPDAATVAANWYELRGGYWPGSTVRHPQNYIPLASGYLEIEHRVTYGQITVVALGLVLAAVWRWQREVAA